MFATSLGGEATLRLLTMPFSDPKKIEQVLGYELESQILGELDGLVYDSVISTTRLRRGRDVDDERHRRRRAEGDGARARRGAGGDRRRAARGRRRGAVVRGACAGTPSPPRQKAPTGETQAIVDFGHKPHQRLRRARRDGAVRALDPARRRGRHRRHRRAVPHVAGRRRGLQAQPGVPGGAGERLRLAGARARRQRRARGAAPAHARAQADGGRLSAPPARAGPTACSSPAGRRGCKGSSSTSRSSSAWSRAAGAHARRSLPRPGDGRARARRRRRGGAWRCRRRRSGWRSRRRRRCRRSTCASWTWPIAPTIRTCAASRDISRPRCWRCWRLPPSTPPRRCAGCARRARRSRRGCAGRPLELFGEAMIDGKAVSEELHGGPKGGAPPVPTMTAYDILDEISHHVPGGDKGKLDITELEIKPKKIYIKGTAETAAAGRRAGPGAGQDRLLRDAGEGQDLDGDGAAVGRAAGDGREAAARAQAVRPHHHQHVPVTGAAR